MRRGVIRAISVLLVTAILSVSAVVSIHFAAGSISPASTRVIGGRSGGESDLESERHSVSAISISDLPGLNAVNTVNFTPDKYLVPMLDVKGEPLALGGTQREFVNKGTYQFVFINLDPWDENFREKSDALSPYLKGDNYWHFTMYLPPILGACNIYVNYTLVERVGELSNYKISDYCDYQERTELHRSKTEPLLIDLKFTSKRDNIPADQPLWSAQVVTVHFEGEGNIAGLTGAPLVGTDSEVLGYITGDKNVVAVLLVISALMLTVFMFMCFLKRTLSYIPQLLIALSVFGILFAAFLWKGSLYAPYLARAIADFSFMFILFAAILGSRIRVGRFPIWLPVAAFVIISAVLAFSEPLTAFSLSKGFILFEKISVVISACAVVIFAVWQAIIKGSAALSVNPLLSAVLALSAVSLPAVPLGLASPILWLFAAMILVTVCISFGVFWNTEKRDRYLAANLQTEVLRQTDSLQKVVEERDRLLMCISHDLKKPIISASEILTDVRAKVDNPEAVRGLDAAIKKNKEISDVLTELSAFSKTNFSKEECTAFNISDVLLKVYDALSPDCVADGVVLYCRIANINVFAQPKSLSSVVYNLILNALDHADCKVITIQARKKKNHCYIEVIDDGKGIPADKDIFAPYISDSENKDNTGLGLYLARAAVEAMGGNLFCTERGGKTVFTVVLAVA